MLTQKKDRKEELKPVPNVSAKIIKIDAPAKKENESKKHAPKIHAGQHHRLPPRSEFNTGYIKGKDNDIL